jgi:hypothetical protein
MDLPQKFSWPTPGRQINTSNHVGRSGNLGRLHFSKRLNRKVSARRNKSKSIFRRHRFSRTKPPLDPRQTHPGDFQPPLRDPRGLAAQPLLFPRKRIRPRNSGDCFFAPSTVYLKSFQWADEIASGRVFGQNNRKHTILSTVVTLNKFCSK